MADETRITIVGNLTDNPELRFIPSGDAVAKFRVASTPRIMDRATNEWKDGEPLFMPVTVWRKPAENVAESFHKGDRVVVVGVLSQRSYDDKEGVKRTVVEMTADEVGAATKFATVVVTRAAKGDGTTRQRGNDDWENAKPAGKATSTPATAAATPAASGGFDDI